MKYEKLNQKARTCMYVVAMIEFVITASVMAIVGILLKNGIIGNGNIAQTVSKILFVLIPTELIIQLIIPNIRYGRYRYLLTEEELSVREGIFVIKKTIVPIERLHKIEVVAGPVARLFGLADVKVTTAGGEVTVCFLENEKADFIAETLKKKINEVIRKERMDGAE